MKLFILIATLTIIASTLLFLPSENLQNITTLIKNIQENKTNQHDTKKEESKILSKSTRQIIEKAEEKEKLKDDNITKEQKKKDSPINFQIEISPDFNRKKMEVMFHDAVNHQRSLEGQSKLNNRTDIARTARKHSRDQATDTQKKIENNELIVSAPIRHEGHTFGNSHVDRLYEKEIYDFSRAGENILSISLVNDLLVTNDIKHKVLKKTWKTPQEVVTEGVTGWMLSKGHKENILTKEYDNSGMGVVRVGDFLIVTQIFVTEASCGYNTGKCCEEEDYLPYCFTDYECKEQSNGNYECEEK